MAGVLCRGYPVHGSQAFQAGNVQSFAQVRLVRTETMWWIILADVLVLGAALWGPIVTNVEQPKYKVIARNKNIEIRNYAPMIVAETEVAGDRDKAISEGFRTIADYIFGNNLSSRKVTMTAPVTQQGIENTWQVRFVMPASYTMDTLPKPTNPVVKLEEVEEKAIRRNPPFPT